MKIASGQKKERGGGEVVVAALKRKKERWGPWWFVESWMLETPKSWLALSPNT